jgi:hypothetical protein
MIRLRFNLHWGANRTKLLWLAAAFCLSVLGGVFLSIKSVRGAETQAAAVYLPAGSGRHVYLTNFSRTPSGVLSACSTGYHMASLWEIADISNLTYDTNHPDAYNKVDSGQGPPALWYGWVRTGYDSSTANTAGTGNCANWTSTTGTAYGTIARLTNNWDVSAGAFSYWEADPWTCAGTAPVWCVGNFSNIHIPLVVK